MKQILKIGDKVKVLKKNTEYFNVIGTIVYDYEDGDFKVGFSDDNEVVFLTHELQLIKPTKKIKKWKYSRERIDKELADFYEYMPKSKWVFINGVRILLLATKSQPIKEERIPRFKDMPDWNKCADRIEGKECNHNCGWVIDSKGISHCGNCGFSYEEEKQQSKPAGGGATREQILKFENSLVTGKQQSKDIEKEWKKYKFSVRESLISSIQFPEDGDLYLDLGLLNRYLRRTNKNKIVKPEKVNSLTNKKV